jgi:hypothetical protein
MKDRFCTSTVFCVNTIRMCVDSNGMELEYMRVRVEVPVRTTPCIGYVTEL